MSNIIDSIQLSGVTYTLSGETNGDVLSGVTLDVTTSNRKLRAYGNKMNGGNTSQSTINFYDGKTIKYTSGDGLYVNFSASTPSITYLNTGSSVIWGFVPSQPPGYDEAFDSLAVNFNSGYTGSTTSYDITVSCSSGGTSSFSDTYTYNVSNNTLTFSSGNHITDVTMDGYTAVFTINSSYSGYKLIHVVNWNGMICGIDTANKDPYSITGVSTSSYDYNGQVIIDDIYTKLGNKQDTLSAGTGISISGNVISATGSSIEVSSAITSGDTNSVAGGAVYDKFDEVEQVTARALIDLNEKKQDTLSAGTGISISGNVISATGGGGGNPTVELTQAEYDALVSAGTVSADTYYIITDATPIDLTNYYTKSETNTLLGGKQATLVSGTNIKTINNESILGSGNIDIQGGSTYTAGRGIDITNDTISFNLPISAGTGTRSVVEGNTYNIANGESAHAEGYKTTASTYAHSEGNQTKASGASSHAEGSRTIANNSSEHASGQFNVSNKASTTFGDSGNTLFSVGNGTSTSARHNAFEIRQNGDIYLSLNGQDVKLQDQLGGSSITVDTALDSGSTNPVENRVIYNKIDEVEQVTAAGLNALNDNFGGLKLVKLTQSEYDGLTTKDPSTLYVIVD